MVEGTPSGKGREEAGVIGVTVLFSIFLVVLIVLADLGKLGTLFSFVNRFPLGDKFAHFFLIGFLSFLVNKTALRLSPGKNPRWVSLIVTMALLLLFTLEEISQIPIADRNASLSDLAANYAGIMTFSLLAWRTRKKDEDNLISKSEE